MCRRNSSCEHEFETSASSQCWTPDLSGAGDAFTEFRAAGLMHLIITQKPGGRKSAAPVAQRTNMAHVRATQWGAGRQRMVIQSYKRFA